jgi:hypothetical protein
VAVKTPYRFLENLDAPGTFYDAYTQYYHEVTLIKYACLDYDFIFVYLISL